MKINFGWMMYVAILAGILIDTFIYPGVIKRYFLIDLGYLLLIWTVIVIFYRSKRENLAKLIKFNNKLVLPASIILLMVFGLIEMDTYPNFVFSKYRIFFYNFVYVFWLGSITAIFGKGLKDVLKKWKGKIFGLSLVLGASFVFLYFWPNDLFAKMGCEDCVLENFQFGFYILSGIMAIKASKLIKKEKIFKYFYVIAGIVLIFIAFEEISWGQRIFNYSVPYVQSSNYKNEINIHNHNMILGLLNYMYIIIGLYGSLSYFFLRKFGKWVNFISPSPEYFLYFFSLVIAYSRIFLADKLYQDEVAEFMFSLGCLLFLTRNWLWLKKTKNSFI